MRYIVCYDFVDDRARARFAKLLSKYGFRMQYSVFEFKLDKLTWSKLKSEMHKKGFLNGKHNIIIFTISEAVYKKMEYYGDFFLAFRSQSLVVSAIGMKHSS